MPSTSYGKHLGETGALTASTISFYWGLSQKITELDTHNIFLANDYKSSFDDIFKRHTLPDDPSFYVNVPSRIDATAAPDGKETLVVLVPVSHIMPNNENRIDELIKFARSKVIQTLQTRLKIEKFEELIETETINDPRTWQSKFNLWKGSALGLSHNIMQVLHFRPSTRSHLFKNLYFVGASAHPGTGVPIVLCGAKLVEKQIMEDNGMIERTDVKTTVLCQYFILVIAIFLFIHFLMKFF